VSVRLRRQSQKYVLEPGEGIAVCFKRV